MHGLMRRGWRLSHGVASEALSDERDSQRIGHAYGPQRQSFTLQFHDTLARRPQSFPSECIADVLLRDMMRIAGYHGSGDPSHGQSVLDELRSRQEEFGIVSPESCKVLFPQHALRSLSSSRMFPRPLPREVTW